MVLDGTQVESHGDGVAIAIAHRLLADLGATCVPSAAPGTHVDGIASAAFGDLAAPRPGTMSHHAVHAIGGALMAQWSHRPGPVLLTVPYCEVALGTALPMLALARRLGLWSGDGASALEALFVLQSGAYSYGPAPTPGRWNESPRGQHPSYSLYPCRDGWVFLGALSPGLALKAFAALGITERVDAHMLEAMFDKAAPARDALRSLLGDTLVAMPLENALACLRAAGVPCSPANQLRDATEMPLARRFEGQPLVDVSLEPGVERLLARPPRRLRVLEVAGYISGPFVGRLMADFGADVIKLEPVDGDPLRRQGLSFAAWNYGKRAAPVDLRSDAGQRLFRALAAEADVIVTNYLPSALKHLRLEARSIFAANPNAIVVNILGYPEGSGREGEAAFDPAIQATFGLMRLQGGADEPVKPQIAASDYVAAMLAVSGVLAVLHRRQERGERSGARVVTSLAAAGYLLSQGALRQPGGLLQGGTDFEGRPGGPRLAECRDGWILLEPGPAGASGGTAGAIPFVAPLDRDAAIALAARSGFAATPCLHPDVLPGELRLNAGSLFHMVHDELGQPVLTPRLFGMAPASMATPALASGPGSVLTWD